MGSAIAGLRAGSLASLYFAGSMALVNILILLLFKSEVLAVLQNDSGCSSPDYCYSVLLSTAIPIDVFVRIFVVAIIFAIIFGLYFDYLPGTSYLRRAILISLIMVVTMFFIGLTGLAANAPQQLVLTTIQVVLAVTWGLILARLYRRFTREVEFKSERPQAIKILVDRRPQTGRKRTFALHSTHKVEASNASDESRFKEWLVSGGVSVEDAKSPTTRIKIDGDGLLKAA